MRKRFRRRASIEPFISHLKHDFRLLRGFLKAFLRLAAAAWNFHKWMRLFVLFWLRPAYFQA
jgi:IS5 family transposase